MSDRPPICRIVDSDELDLVFQRYGHPADDALFSYGVPDVRAYAAMVRTTPDTDLPGRNALIADALDALCDAAEARPVDPWDRPNFTGPVRDELTDLAIRCKRRSVLLERFARDLNQMAVYGCVRDVRQVLDVLADVDLLLPGTDAALRPLLAPYAGLTDPIGA